ncbi:MAG: L,D-transpeptidase family protein [Methylocystaceae bacterium]|nr:L,D-transpeptidase family protein [Methylocystaceae bacterium]
MDTIKVFGDNRLIWQDKTYPCALGKNGITADKKEGDLTTPVGRYKIRRVLYRPDRLNKPACHLDITALTTQDGWCDDIHHAKYNRPVKLPFSASHEQLWRDDHIYDIIVILGHNDNPPIAGKGSAIFFHLARKNYEPTQGCVAVSLPHMLEILETLPKTAEMEIFL